MIIKHKAFFSERCVRLSHECFSDTAPQLIKQMCNHQRECSLTASNEAFGDPCTGFYYGEYLNVSYKCKYVPG